MKLRYTGIVVFGIALLLRFVFLVFPGIFEAVYFKTVFPAVRRIIYPIGSLLPIAGYYILIGIALIWLVWRFPRKRIEFKIFGRRLLNFLGGSAALFLFLWGYLYVGASLAERMNLPSTEEKYNVAKLYISTMKEATELRKDISLPHDSASVEDLINPSGDTQATIAVGEVLSRYGYPTDTPVKIRKVKPEGTLRRLGIGGIYNPFTGEANVESSAGAITGTFTTAHEVAHAMGITGEGEANFAAYLALRQSDNPISRYAAAYSLWRYVAREVRLQLSEEEQAMLAALIPEELNIDRRAIWKRASLHEAYFPEISETLNDSYLKIQGVEAGAEDYNAFVELYLRHKSAITE